MWIEFEIENILFRWNINKIFFIFFYVVVKWLKFFVNGELFDLLDNLLLIENFNYFIII